MPKLDIDTKYFLTELAELTVRAADLMQAQPKNPHASMWLIKWSNLKRELDFSDVVHKSNSYTPGFIDREFWHRDQ